MCHVYMFEIRSSIVLNSFSRFGGLLFSYYDFVSLCARFTLLSPFFLSPGVVCSLVLQ